MSLQNRVLHTVLFVLTPIDTSIPSITLKADTVQTEEMFLSEPQFKNPKADTFISADGENGALVQNQGTNGTRDMTFFETPTTEELTGWSQKKPMVVFNMSFSYDVDNNGGVITKRIQKHKSCTFTGPGIPGIGGNGAPVIKFPIAFMSLKKEDGTGKQLGT